MINVASQPKRRVESDNSTETPSPTLRRTDSTVLDPSKKTTKDADARRAQRVAPPRAEETSETCEGQEESQSETPQPTTPSYEEAVQEEGERHEAPEVESDQQQDQDETDESDRDHEEEGVRNDPMNQEEGESDSAAQDGGQSDGNAADGNEERGEEERTTMKKSTKKTTRSRVGTRPLEGVRKARPRHTRTPHDFDDMKLYVWRTFKRRAATKYPNASVTISVKAVDRLCSMLHTVDTLLGEKYAHIFGLPRSNRTFSTQKVLGAVYLTMPRTFHRPVEAAAYNALVNLTRRTNAEADVPPTIAGFFSM